MVDVYNSEVFENIFLFRRKLQKLFLSVLILTIKLKLLVSTLSQCTTHTFLIIEFLELDKILSLNGIFSFA